MARPVWQYFDLRDFFDTKTARKMRRVLFGGLTRPDTKPTSPTQLDWLVMKERAPHGLKQR